MQTSTPQKKLIRITTVPMALRYLLPGQMNYMNNNGYDVVMISADGKELPEVIEKEGCRHITVPMTRKITPVQDLKCLIQLVKIFREEKPDIVHSHTPKAGLLGMMAAKIAGVKTRIHTVAGLPMMVEKGFKFSLLKAVEKMTYASANHVWPNSPSLLQYIKKENLSPAHKIDIIGKGSTNGINTSRFNPKNLKPAILENIKHRIDYNCDNHYLLCMGRLVKDKGIIELVHAFTALQNENEKLRLILVGDFEEALDPLPQDIMEQIKSNDSIIHVKWTTEVEYFMHLADCFIFASHREGFPNVLLQAGAMQLPIICSRITGNVDIVENNVTGLIFDAGNENQLSSLIRKSIEQKNNMLQMAKKLSQLIIENYQTSSMWQKISEQYAIVSISKQRAPYFSITSVGNSLVNFISNIAFGLQARKMPRPSTSA